MVRENSRELTSDIGIVAVSILEGVVKNNYASDVGKPAAWISASHLEKAPKKKAPPTS